MLIMKKNYHIFLKYFFKLIIENGEKWEKEKVYIFSSCNEEKNNLRSQPVR